MSDLGEDLLVRAGCSRAVREHCRKVKEAAEEYLNPLVDQHLVETGALLHDVGRSITHSPAHAQAGAALARDMGVSPSVVRIIECHLGAGLTSDECTLLRLIPRDCMPSTLEEKIVAHSDTMVQGSTICHLPTSAITSSSLKRRVRKRMLRLALEMRHCRDIRPDFYLSR